MPTRRAKVLNNVSYSRALKRTKSFDPVTPSNNTNSKKEVLFEVRVNVKETQVAIKLPEGIAPLSQCRNKRSILPWQISLHFIAKYNQVTSIS
jgi:hypothetical protein